MLELVLSSRNEHKLKEFRSILGKLGFHIVPVSQFDGVPVVEEDGDTFEANAVKKAVEVSKALGLPAIADDSGLEVDYLGGAPGVWSARYAGENATDEENNRKLLAALEGVPEGQRSARFRCVIAFAVPDEYGNVDVETAEGVCEGVIAFGPRGSGGFGYDPLFIVPEYGKTFAELPAETKNRVSHRAKALEQAYCLLEAWKKKVWRV